MKKYILAIGILVTSLLGASLSAQGLPGATLSADNSSPAASASSMMSQVASPTCEFEELTLRELISAAFSSPSTRRAGLAAIALLRQGIFNENAIRAFLVVELCEN